MQRKLVDDESWHDSYILTMITCQLVFNSRGLTTNRQIECHRVVQIVVYQIAASRWLQNKNLQASRKHWLKKESWHDSLIEHHFIETKRWHDGLVQWLRCIWNCWKGNSSNEGVVSRLLDETIWTQNKLNIVYQTQQFVIFDNMIKITKKERRCGETLKNQVNKDDWYWKRVRKCKKSFYQS